MGDPQALGQLVEKFVEKRRWSFLFETRLVSEVWDRVISTGVKMHCKISSCKGRRLELHADSSVWAQEVSMLVPELTDLLNREAGKTIVEDIVVRVRRKSG